MSQNVAPTPPSTSLHYIILMLPLVLSWDSEEQENGTNAFLGSNVY
jgi:hypothetical protein